ncbi:lipocalin family protein [Spirosoma sp. BT702]|uniref:Lipocalin family protein n=1 Tax=Spirosoma profusum TaxID=2771354 RepID=A0A926XUR6_9BACT|nr:lipocalin family protein [Spirosoma profusum]MBD2700823.1 lipocalin family protein [Spirosoma profusum]
MKNSNFSRLFAYVLLVTIPVWFNACKKEETTPTPTPSNSVEGSYKVTSLKVDPKAAGLYDDLLAASKLLFNNTTCLTDITITFKSNGDATTDNPTSCQNLPVAVSMFTGVDASSKWAFANNKLTITKSDNTKTEYTVVSNTGGLMKLQWQGALNYPTPSATVYTYTMELKKQ